MVSNVEGCADSLSPSLLRRHLERPRCVGCHDKEGLALYQADATTVGSEIKSERRVAVKMNTRPVVQRDLPRLTYASGVIGANMIEGPGRPQTSGSDQSEGSSECGKAKCAVACRNYFPLTPLGIVGLLCIAAAQVSWVGDATKLAPKRFSVRVGFSVQRALVEPGTESAVIICTCIIGRHTNEPGGRVLGDAIVG